MKVFKKIKILGLFVPTLNRGAPVNFITKILCVLHNVFHFPYRKNFLLKFIIHLNVPIIYKIFI